MNGWASLLVSKRRYDRPTELMAAPSHGLCFLAALVVLDRPRWWAVRSRAAVFSASERVVFATKALDLSGGDQNAPANAYGLQLSSSGQPMKAGFANTQNFHRIASRVHARRAFITCQCPDGGHVLSSKLYTAVQLRTKDYTVPRCFFLQPTGQNRPSHCRKRLFGVGFGKDASSET